MISIRQQLQRYLIFVAVMAVLLLVLISNIGMNAFLSNYFIRARQNRDLEIVSIATQIFSMDRTPTPSDLVSIRHAARMNDVAIQILDNQSKVVYATDYHTTGRQGVGRRIEEVDLVWQSYPLVVSTQKIGYVNVGRPDPIFATDMDRRFIIGINLMYAASFLFVIFIAYVLSRKMSIKFLQPLYTLKSNVHSIKQGQYENLNEMKTETHELVSLSEEIKALSKRLANQEALRKRLTADVAHEFRTPLATLQSRLEAMLDEVIKADQPSIIVCYDEVIRLSKLVSDISDLSKIENRDVVMEKTRIDFSLVVQHSIEYHKPLFESTERTLQANLSPSIYVLGNADRLTQVMNNLLSNAYKYTNEKTAVTVSLEKQGQQAVMVVADQGPGISKEDLPFIFERFYRGDRSRSRATGGTGIGLSITKAIINAHGGSIDIQSAQNQGTKVIVSIPIEA